MFKVLLDYPSFLENARFWMHGLHFSRNTRRTRYSPRRNPTHAQISGSDSRGRKIRDYVVHLVFATRTPEKYNLDIKTFHPVRRLSRATIYLTLAAKAWALLQGREYVTPRMSKALVRTCCAIASSSPMKPRHKP